MMYQLDEKEFLRKYTTVKSTFINDFFSLYTSSSTPSDHVIDLGVVAKWLECQKGTLKQTLKKSYVQSIDYIVSKPLVGKGKRGFAKVETILLTADCFKTMCMQSKTKKAAEVRAYFLAVEKALFVYREEIIQGMNKRIGILERNQKSVVNAKPVSGGVIYIIKASESIDSVYKIGKTTDLANRLRSHGSACADSLDVIYVYKTSCIDKVEQCMKMMLKERQYRKRKEVYQVDLDMLKDVIKACDDACLAVTYRKRGKSNHTGGYYAVLLEDVPE